MPELKSGDNLDDHVRYFNEELAGKRGKDLEFAINDTRAKLLDLLSQATKDPNLGKNPETVSFLKGKLTEISQKTSLLAGEVKDPLSNKSKTISYPSVLEKPGLPNNTELATEYLNSKNKIFY